jgi:hypothetical protein
MPQPPAVPPETADWTFVVDKGCTQCGFSAQDVESTADRLRATIPQWREALSGQDAAERPEPTVPAEVADQLAAEAEATATAFAAVRPDRWERPGRRSNGSLFTVRTFAIYFLHDVEHHVHDVAR